MARLRKSSGRSPLVGGVTSRSCTRLKRKGFAVEARSSPRAFPLPAPRADLLKSIETLDRRVILCGDEQARREAAEAS